MSKKNSLKISLVFKNEGKLYKFFWLNFDRKDDSVYFNFYPLKNANPAMKHKIFSGKEIIAEREIVMDNAATTVFEAEKYSYHRSGLIHVKSKQGKPLEPGFYFLPFDKLGEKAQFASLVPSFPHNYPEVQEADLKNKSIIIDTAGFENIAFSISLFLLSKASTSLPSSSLSNYRDIECVSEKYPFRILVRVSSTNKPCKNDQLMVTPSMTEVKQA